MEALLQVAVNTSSQPAATPYAQASAIATSRETVSGGRRVRLERNRSTGHLTESPTELQNSWQSLGGSAMPLSTQLGLGQGDDYSAGPSQSPLSPAPQEVNAATYQENPLDSEEIVIQLQKVNWEHHGPGSWVSICSPPGLKWVCERIGTNEFIESAKLMVHTWSSRLTIKNDPVALQKQPEPDAARAWEYTSAYFEYCYDAVFGIVHRPAFEAQLSRHLEQQREEQPPEEDPSWYALRNVVCAAGCRCLLARDPQVSFVEAQAEAWRLFSNAMSVFTALLFRPSGLLNIQALALMTFYVEGLGSPALEYFLSSLAVRMAQGKGLHRQPARSWRLPESELLQRNWLWWTVYCLDKQVAFRSGRPSAIDYDNISAELPKAAPPGSTIDVHIITYIVRHAQISTQISRRIMSVRAFQQSLPELIVTVRDVQHQLDEFRLSLPDDLQIDEDVLSPQDRQSTSQLLHKVYIRFAFYGSMMAAHIPFFYPWIAARYRTTDSNVALDKQIALSSAAIAAEAGKIILALRSLTIDVSVPAWLAFYYPMYAHINMFVHILKSPGSAATPANLALLDVCAGHFGHMDFVTRSEVSFPFAKESAALAYKMVRTYAESKEADRIGIPALNSRLSSDMLASNQTHDVRLMPTEFEAPLYFDSVSDNDFNFMDFNVNACEIFGPAGEIENFGGMATFHG